MKASARNIATLGRLLAAAVIIAGIGLAVWDAIAVPGGFLPRHYKLRFFFGESLEYIWLGGLLLAVAEIAGRLGAKPEGGRIDWRVPTLLRVLGLTIIAGGIGLVVWNARSVPPVLSLLSFTTVNNSGWKRAAARSALEFAWRGGLLIVAAALAERLGWGGGDEEEPAVAAFAAPAAN